jgi:hypothetical protein
MHQKTNKTKIVREAMERGKKKTKLMVQQLAGEAMEKNKKRVQQLVGKEIHRLESKRNKRNPHARKTIAIVTL